MRQANVYVDGQLAGYLIELERKRRFRFTYLEGYCGLPVSLTMPLYQQTYEYDGFPSFFDNLLPEGMMLDALLRSAKIDSDDYFSQLLTVGGDLVGNVTVKAA